MADVEIITLFNLFPELPEVIQRAVVKATKKAAFLTAGYAKGNHPFTRQTGFLEASIYVQMKGEVDDGWDFATRAAAAAGENPDGVMLDEVEKPSSPTVAYVAVGANYGLYVEMGTVHAAAYPYLIPAAEIVMPEYLAALRALEDSLEL